VTELVPEPETAVPADDAEAPTPPERYVPVRFVEVTLTLPSTHPIVVLEELDGPRRQLRFPIGLAEASAIAYADKKIPTPRPLTHAFMTSVLEALGGTLETVRIVDATGTIFGAEAEISSPMGHRTVPCRPSDGICLALRQRPPAPITVAGWVLDEHGYATTER
jgi:uncharacterized protein